MSTVDLNELAKRESERVEWKEGVADIDNVARTAVAFANDYANLGGGYIVCGAKEEKDEYGFQRMVRIGLTSARCKEVENKLLTVLRDNVSPPITPLTEEIRVDDEHRILIFIVPSSSSIHALTSHPGENGVYYYRDGRETRVAKNGTLREMLAQKNAIEPWDRRPNFDASLEDIDLLALRDILQAIGVWKDTTSLEDYLSPIKRIYALTPPLVSERSITRKLYPKNFTLLLFGKDLTKYFPGAYTIFSLYRGLDRSEPNAERHEIIGNIVYQVRRCIELLNAESYTVFDKQSDVPNQRKYPQKALQEAVVNAIVHRDYENDQPTRITVFADRIEFNSPGALPRSVDKDKFISGKASPHWRNQSLAFFFNKMQLAQAEGQGIPTILRAMKEEGCPNPYFEVETEKVICTLPAHPRHMLMRRFQNIEQNIVLRNTEIAIQDLQNLLNGDPYNYRAIDLFCEACTLQNVPEEVLNFIDTKKIDFEKINSATLLVLADVLVLISPKNPRINKIIQEMLTRASKSAVEGKHLERIVQNLRRIESPAEVINYIDQTYDRIPQMKDNSIFIETWARAKLDLVKICIDTGKNKQKYSFKRRQNAWQTAKRFLEEAERELNRALEKCENEIGQTYIHKDLQFVNTLKKKVYKLPRKQDKKT